MKKRKNKMPIFITNQPKPEWHKIDLNDQESKKNRENQKKLMLNNKNNKY